MRKPTDTNCREGGGYHALALVLEQALSQAAEGKGHERHGAGKPFDQQPILEIARMLGGVGGHAYQIMKKAQEANRMVERQQHAQAIAELFGVINYAAAAVIRSREIDQDGSDPTPTRP